MPSKQCLGGIFMVTWSTDSVLDENEQNQLASQLVVQE